MLLEVSPHVHSLLDFSYPRHFQAPSGEHGRGKDQHGRKAEDLILRVPPGTWVRDASTREVLGDLTQVGERLVVAQGGQGGKGNARFATATRQAPRFSLPPGDGEEKWILLELKLLADVGLVGLPNAGKSTLLSRLSCARPQIAPYPFTTLRPHLGVLESEDGERLILADIPGLVEGAHRGVGLGLRFLRHVERTRMFLHILDMDPSEGRDPLEDFRVLKEEMGQYDAGLLEKPELVALNKMDLPGAGARSARVKRRLKAKGLQVFPVSGLTGEGIEELGKALLAAHRALSGEPQESGSVPKVRARPALQGHA